MDNVGSPQQVLGDRLQLHVGRALVDLSDLRVTKVFLRGIVLRISVAAVDLHDQRCDVFANLRRKILRHRGLRGRN